MERDQRVIIDKNQIWKERCGIICACEKDTVIYYCTNFQCPENKKDAQYCSKCKAKHENCTNIMMYDKVSEFDATWNTQKEHFDSIAFRARKRYRELYPLIHYFESEMVTRGMLGQDDIIMKSITEDLSTLDQINKDFREVLTRVESLVITGDLSTLR